MTAQTSSHGASRGKQVRSGTRSGARHRAVSPAQRARIVSAAEQLIIDGGSRQVTVGGICTAARVSRSTFYATFEDRGQCLLEIFDKASAEVGSAMAGAYRAGGTWLDAVRGALFELLAFLEDRPGLARLMIIESFGGDAALRARRGELLATFARVLEADAPPAAVNALPAPFGGEAVVGAVASILHARLREDPVPSLRGMCGQMMGVIVLPYLNVAAVRRELARPTPFSPGPYLERAGKGSRSLRGCADRR
jgi:AcrR family transcriptional regulator